MRKLNKVMLQVFITFFFLIKVTVRSIGFGLMGAVSVYLAKLGFAIPGYMLTVDTLLPNPSLYEMQIAFLGAFLPTLVIGLYGNIFGWSDTLAVRGVAGGNNKDCTLNTDSQARPSFTENTDESHHGE